MYFTLENKLFSTQLINTEQERDKLSIEINRLSMQSQHLKSTLERVVAEHSKTLERINELWKQKWPGAYDEVSRIHCMGVCHDNGFIYLSAASMGREVHHPPIGIYVNVCTLINVLFISPHCIGF